MKVVAVLTNHTGDPAGWWYGDPDHARMCDYLVEEVNQQVENVYSFSGVTDRDAQGRFAFLGLSSVNPIILNRIRNDLDLSRKTGNAQVVRYFDL